MSEKTSILSRLTLVQSMVAVLLLPIIVAAGLGAVIVLDRLGTVTEINRNAALVELGKTMSESVHEQQKERGATAVFINTNGQSFANELRAQRATTDPLASKALAEVRAFDTSEYGMELKQMLANIERELSRMSEVRRRIDGLSISAAEAINYYTALNGLMLEVYGYIAEHSSVSVLTQQSLSVGQFLQGKERAGIERAVGSSGFAAGEFAPAVFSRFSDLIVRQDVFFSNFLSGATADQVRAFEAFSESGPAKDVTRMRDAALSAGANNPDLGGFNGQDFFNAQTARINLLKDMENRLVDDLGAMMSELKTNAQFVMWETIAICVVALGAAIAVGLWLAFALRRQMVTVINGAAEMSQGNLDVVLPPQSKNEVGRLIGALDEFRQSIVESRQRDAEMRAREAEEMEAKTAREAHLRGQSEKIAVELEQAAEAIEELATSVRDNAKSTESASNKASAILEKAREGNGVARSAVEAMNRIKSSSDEISSITNLIDEISFQTNLLALNARVEAARAGEAGRGFAVVASEVQALAGRSAKAARDIAELIQQSTQHVNDGTRTVDESGAVLATISVGVEEISEMINSISISTNEQNGAINSISRNASSLDEAMQELTADGSSDGGADIYRLAAE
ncbi:MAG: nitrate- and nitrite sensing domain-containing protein [Marivivens sp.]|nr:nitrate- and nitrite sensing domain-containing protein [Marivivens sp.]